MPKKYDDYVTGKLPTRHVNNTQIDSSASYNVFVEPSLAYLDTDVLHSLANVLSSFEPSSYNQAKEHPEWIQAIEKELAALEENDTWELVQLPIDKKPIASKWVFKTKFKPNGEVDRCKARVVARGDKQISGKDYKHTFSPVAKLTTVRIVMALAAAKNWDIQQLDINNAFLHGYLEEEVYMTPHAGYKKAKSGQVCKLKRFIYGLKQASRCWNQELSKFLIKWGFIQSKQDYSMFTLKKENDFTVVVAYVDDLLITGNNTSTISTLKSALHQTFTIKDLGDIKYFLGIEVSRSNSGVIF